MSHATGSIPLTRQGMLDHKHNNHTNYHTSNNMNNTNNNLVNDSSSEHSYDNLHPGKQKDSKSMQNH